MTTTMIIGNDGGHHVHADGGIILIAPDSEIEIDTRIVTGIATGIEIKIRRAPRGGVSFSLFPARRLISTDPLLFIDPISRHP